MQFSKGTQPSNYQLTSYPLHLSPICGGERCAYRCGDFGRHRGAPACVPAGALRLWLQRLVIPVGAVKNRRAAVAARPPGHPAVCCTGRNDAKSCEHKRQRDNEPHDCLHLIVLPHDLGGVFATRRRAHGSLIGRDHEPRACLCGTRSMRARLRYKPAAYPVALGENSGFKRRAVVPASEGGGGDGEMV